MTEQVRYTIIKYLEIALGHARDDINRATIQLNRMPYDHDTRDILNDRIAHVHQIQTALDWVKKQ